MYDPMKCPEVMVVSLNSVRDLYYLCNLRYEIYNTIDYYLTNTLAHLLILTGVLCTKTSLDYI